MGKITGFLDYNRVTSKYKPVEERIQNYKEFLVPIAENELCNQGARCMDCGIPYCHSMGCPLYNLIPEWNDYIYNGHWREALIRLEATNNFPEITGRICPAPCEAACTLSINNAPVTIKQIELAIIEHGFSQGWIVPHPPKKESGKKVAVIGSGPSGFAAAQQLRRAGHSVTVFEKNHKIGGLLRYGIPDYKLDKHIIDRRVKQMEAEGVKFETNVTIGDDISVRYLKKSFDAILLTMGAGHPRDLIVTGRDLKGIHFALDYLTESNKVVSGEIPENKRTLFAKDKVVLVIGGGDTGSDCVGTANRQGAKKVYQFEIMPKPMEWTDATNPNWPYWPNILRTSSSHEEGCERDWCIQTKEFIGNGVLQKGKFTRVEWKKTGKDASTKPVDIPGSEFTLDIDLVFLAMGFIHVEHSKLLEDLSVELDQRGNVKCTKDYQTSVDGVFAAGDANTGASLVVRGFYHGREAASAIDRYLSR